MKKILYLEGASGISGDMTVAALLEHGGSREKLEGEFGDLLFALVNACRLYGVDPESALERTNKKFIQRFNYMEERAAAKGYTLHEMSLGAMEELWQEAKRN